MPGTGLSHACTVSMAACCAYTSHTRALAQSQVQPFLAQHAGISTDRGSHQAPPAAAAVQPSLPPHLDFSDSSQVFAMRSTGDLLRMYGVLKVRLHDLLVEQQLCRLGLCSSSCSSHRGLLPPSSTSMCVPVRASARQLLQAGTERARCARLAC